MLSIRVFIIHLLKMLYIFEFNEFFLNQLLIQVQRTLKIIDTMRSNPAALHV